MELLKVGAKGTLVIVTTGSKRINFPRLLILTFKKCLELIELPQFPTLENLRIWTRNNASFLSRRDIGSLEIHGLSSLNKIPIGLLQYQTHLEELTIASLPELVSLLNQLGKFSSSANLDIQEMPELIELPQFSTLENL